MTTPEPKPADPGTTARRSLPSAALALLAAAVFVVALMVFVGLNPGLTVALLAAILVATAAAYRLMFGPVRRVGHVAVGRAVAAAAVGAAVVVGIIQAFPYGRDHTNPPIVSEPDWDSPRTRELAAAACFLCHSNETRWPGYAAIAPISWALAGHVADARDTMNFSDWERRPMGADEIAEVVEEGEMPPWNFRLLHREARLTDAEKAELIAGIRATLGG